jgi:hypothetical protein
LGGREGAMSEGVKGAQVGGEWASGASLLTLQGEANDCWCLKISRARCFFSYLGTKSPPVRPQEGGRKGGGQRA